ncbi:hypothetical protein K413DRAFT_4798 [Clostridium sp. ASBs410]|nr:hypothetical protein K413DRAFT_4798 [Clostridium sp. ASBs410]
MKPKNNDIKINAIPKSVFTPFKNSKAISVFFSLICTLFSLIILVNVLLGKISFSVEQLREVCNFTISFIFAISALGFTIFSIHLKQEHPKKEDIIFSYIGEIILLASMNIFAYIISFLNFLPSFTLGIMSCSLLFLLSRCISGLLSTIVAYFNIRD